MKTTTIFLLLALLPALTFAKEDDKSISTLKAEIKKIEDWSFKTKCGSDAVEKYAVIGVDSYLCRKNLEKLERLSAELEELEAQETAKQRLQKNIGGEFFFKSATPIEPSE